VASNVLPKRMRGMRFDGSYAEVSIEEGKSRVRSNGLGRRAFSSYRKLILVRLAGFEPVTRCLEGIGFTSIGNRSSALLHPIQWLYG